MQHTSTQPCPACSEMTKESNYLKECLISLFSQVDWLQLMFIVFGLVFAYSMGGWIGLGIGMFIYYISSALEGGACLGIGWDKEETEEEHNFKCSASLKDCQLCGNEYSHEFNVKMYNEMSWFGKMWHNL